MTTNREELWRLEDAEGRPVADPPYYRDEELRFFDGSLVNRRRIPASETSPYAAFRNRRSEPTRNFAVEHMGDWVSEMNREERVRRETIDAVEDVDRQIMQEIDRYRRRLYTNPEYISLSRAAYISLRAITGGLVERGHVESFMGIELMCNPLQTQPVMVLGTGRQEGLGGGLYRE